MTLAELVEEYERRRAEAAEHQARVPMARVYSIVLEDLRQLDGGGRPTRMMTTNEAASILGVARKTVAGWAAEGRFANARKTSESGEWRIPAIDVYRESDGEAPETEGVERLWSPESG